MKIEIKLNLTKREYMAFRDDCLINAMGVVVNGVNLARLYKQMAKQVEKASRSGGKTK